MSLYFTHWSWNEFKNSRLQSVDLYLKLRRSPGLLVHESAFLWRLWLRLAFTLSAVYSQDQKNCLAHELGFIGKRFLTSYKMMAGDTSVISRSFNYKTSAFPYVATLEQRHFSDSISKRIVPGSPSPVATQFNLRRTLAGPHSVKYERPQLI